MGVIGRRRDRTQERWGTLDNLVSQFGFNGSQYVVSSWGDSGGDGERIENHFESIVAAGYKANGPVFACILARLLVFSEARFQFRSYTRGRPTDLFGSPALQPLEKPWEGGTTGELLARMEQDVSLAGNFFGLKVHGGIRRLRPDWVNIVSWSPSDAYRSYEDDPYATRSGYIYQAPEAEPVGFGVDEVVHYSPIPDPIATHRGMSWLNPVVREVRGDGQMTDHLVGKSAGILQRPFSAPITVHPKQ